MFNQKKEVPPEEKFKGAAISMNDAPAAHQEHYTDEEHALIAAYGEDPELL